MLCGQRAFWFVGTNGVPVDLDKNDLRERLSRLVTVPGGEDGPSTEAYLEEVCRYAAVELHSTAAIVGGVAAQECIKLITKQFVPVHNCLVYNGVVCEASVFCLRT